MAATTADAAMAALRAKASPEYRAGLVRFAIPTENALGVSIPDLRAIAKSFGPDHALALALWKTGIYEARCLAALVDEPARVTPAQMDRWCRDFDNWGVCDTVCFCLFDRTPHAWSKVAQWADAGPEFERRGAFALLAGIALHDKKAPDGPFVDALSLIQRAAPDRRNFVKKGVSWALRSIGHRNPVLHAASVELAGRLAGSSDPGLRWVGKDALRDLTRPQVLRRVAAG